MEPGKAGEWTLSKTLGDGKVQCVACNWKCRIKEGEAGICGVRFNEGGRLVLSVYGRPCAVWVDPIEKKPLYHFLPGSRSYSIGTFGCNFACEFCQNWDISQAPRQAREKDPEGWKEYHSKLVRSCKEMPPDLVVKSAVDSGCPSISFTYNEPTIFAEYAIDIMRIAKRKGLKGVFVTNGYETRECWDALCGWIDAANIDLKAYNKRFYTDLCHVPDLRPVKDSIRYARSIGIHVEVTTLLIPGWNDDPSDLKKEAEWLGSVDPEMPWHLTAFHPDYRMPSTVPTSPRSLIHARKTALNEGLKHVYIGNVPSGPSDYDTTFCPNCGLDLIMREGFATRKNICPDGVCPSCGKVLEGIWR